MDINTAKIQAGHKIRRLRLKSGLDQERFAAMCGIDRGYLSRIEGGSANPSFQKLFDIAEGLGVTLSELFEDVK